ncbi:MAG: HD domain-containing protein [Planctomycetaceae bacterium]|nr:HD domain-containing protein [Planctomycetaceae bacterium]
MEVTPRIRNLLRERLNGTLLMHPDDAAGSTVRQMDPEAAAALKVGSEVASRLDAIVDAGSLFVTNNGPKVRDSLVSHGCTAYKAEKREEVLGQHQAAGKSINNMLQTALKGGQLATDEMSDITAGYLKQMTADCDLLLTAAGDMVIDDSLSHHCLQMAVLGMAIGVELGLDASNVRQVGLCGLVHDWGMVRVPEEIRLSSRRLSDSEFLEIKKHPIYSLQLLEQVNGIPTVVPLVSYQVHESPDGSGYPRGRMGKSIHLFARILKVADAFIGLTTDRPFRPPLLPYAAMESILRLSRKQHFDQDVVRALLGVLSLFPIGSYVVLSDGTAARVIRRNGKNYTKPIVQRIQTADGAACPEGDVIDPAESQLSIVQALPAPGSKETFVQPEYMLPTAQ